MEYGSSTRARDPAGQGDSSPELQSWSGRNCNAFGRGKLDLDVASTTLVLNALVHDQLGLRKYGRQLGGIGIKRNGAVGSVGWAPITGLKSRGCLLLFLDRLSHRAIQTGFFALTGGSTIRFQTSAPSFLTSGERALRHSLTRDHTVRAYVHRPRHPKELPQCSSIRQQGYLYYMASFLPMGKSLPFKAKLDKEDYYILQLQVASKRSSHVIQSGSFKHSPCHTPSWC